MPPAACGSWARWWRAAAGSAAMSYALLPGDRVRYSKEFLEPWRAHNARIAFRMRHMRGTVLGIDAHPKGDILTVRWDRFGVRSVEAKYLRLEKQDGRT